MTPKYLRTLALRLTPGLAVGLCAACDADELEPRCLPVPDAEVFRAAPPDREVQGITLQGQELQDGPLPEREVQGTTPQGRALPEREQQGTTYQGTVLDLGDLNGARLTVADSGAAVILDAGRLVADGDLVGGPLDVARSLHPGARLRGGWSPSRGGSRSFASTTTASPKVASCGPRSRREAVASSTGDPVSGRRSGLGRLEGRSVSRNRIAAHGGGC